MSRPLKILHFAEVINHADFIDTIIRYADPAEFEIAACTMSDENNISAPRYATLGIAHHRLTDRGRLGFVESVRRLGRVLRDGRFDVLHAHHYRGALIGAAAARLSGTPAFVIGRQYHDEIYLLTRGLKRRALLALEGLANARARAIVVPSQPVYDLLVNRQRLDPSRVHVAPYGFDFSDSRYCVGVAEENDAVRREFGLGDSFIVGNFARHHPLKGQEALIRGFEQFSRGRPNVVLLMAGAGPHHDRLEELAERLGLGSAGASGPRVVFTGWRRDVTRLMCAADVVVHPAIHESFCQTMVEALALSKPLVITPVAGPSDHINHLQNGYIIPSADAAAIVEALTWVYDAPTRAAEMGRRGADYVRTRLDARVSVRKFEAIYRGLALPGAE